MDGERRRREKKEPPSKLAAFEKLKAIKSGGQKNKCEIGPLENVYEEVSEKEYTETVLKRQEDDWIVGDYAAEGYVEDGREIFDDDLDEESIKKNQKTKKRDRTIIHKNVEPPKGNLEKMFKNMPAKRKREVKLEDDDVLGSLMEELESPSFKVAKKEISIQKREIFSEAVTSRENSLKIAQDISIHKRDPFSEAVASLGNNINLVKKDKNVQEFDMSPEAMALLEDDILIEPIPVVESVSEKPAVTVENMFADSVAAAQNMFEEPAASEDNLSKTSKVSTENGKKFQKFFYWDAYEDPYLQPGTVFLFGKLWVETTKTYASCCVIVKNIYRKVYFLPREKQKDKDVKLIDVYNEFNEKVADKLSIMKFKSRKLTKHYAFNIPDIPDTCEYLEVQYPASDPALPANLTGETFSHVFGVNTGYLEIFLLDRKIKGPSWLAISDSTIPKISFSWCKFELVCDDISNITVINDGQPPPPLVVMSLNIRVTPIPKSYENQITMVGWLVHNEYCTDRPAPSPQFKDHFCAFTKPAEVMFPVDTKASKEELAKHSSTNVEKLNSERALLAFFLAKFHKIDPDLIVGHDIYGFDIGTLIHRVVINKIPHWSRLGRLRRQEVPKSYRGKNYVERNLICGRLLCDIKISAKELIRARSYDLSSLCELVLHMKEGERKEVKTEAIKDMYSSSDLLIGLIKLTMSDALYVLRIMYDLNSIPLSLQITSIAGNVMSRTLMGGRAERNEYLLLHAFNEKDYIVPDKMAYGKNAAKNENIENESKAKGKRKPQYEGGLVLDPKTGFYDKFILLMDFNSLYPSIIQEYNICFTTIPVRAIQMNNEDDVVKLMKYLPSNTEPGILPTEIKKLVESRRQVKALMKKQDISPVLRHQYDIRQLALKLTANSMYGCLGFSNSRFYAKPLAAMITAKGREILLNTRDLVQRLRFDVIYGDTDSLMINTSVVDYDEVFNIGKKIKFEVNKLYKQIELDIDGVFKYMLLLKKKKYAAVTVTKVNGKLIMKQEIKGLDVVRRDWSQLSAEAGKFVLQQILSDQSLDDKLAKIHAHLEKLKTDLHEQRVPVSLLAITKQLTKNPEEYPDKKSLPHVQVALRMNSTRAKKFRQGDTIAYVICQDGTSNVALQRAYHVDEFKTKDDLAIDINYYLSQQIHPVVSRLCEFIDGIDAILIAESLGLDIVAYQNIRPLEAVINEDDITTDRSQMFKNCDNFQFKCPNQACGIVNSIDAPCIRNDDGNLEFVLSRCANKSCGLPPYEYLSRLQNKLWLLMQDYVHKYYQHWLICEERTCLYRTRNIVKYNKRFEIECLQCGRGNLVPEYSESQLYTQLSFFQYVFDYTLFMSQYKELKLDAKSPIAMAYSKLKDSVDIMLMWNSYNAVSLGKLNKLMAMK